MPHQADELSPLAPDLVEVGIAVVSLLHVVLIAALVIQLLRGRTTLPHGLSGLLASLFVLLFLPVVGPLLVLTWPGRVERHRARAQHSGT